MDNMDLQSVIMAIIASVIAPSIMAFFTNRQRRMEKKEDHEIWKEQKETDWRRQDEVAQRAAETAELLIAADDRLREAQDEVARHAREVAALLLAANERVARSAITANTKLDQIHALVDGNMTVAMQSELDATVRELALLKEVGLLHLIAGQVPSEEAKTTIAHTEARIKVLRQEIKSRADQVKTV